MQQLLSLGWRVLTVWECAFRAPNAQTEAVVDKCIAWLDSDHPVEEIRGPYGSGERLKRVG